MGTFRVTVDIGDLAGERWVRVEALVDTGASHTLLPAPLLDGLGISRAERWPFELADGRIAEHDIGHALVRWNGKQVATIVVFGDEGVEPILGAYVLEGLRLAPDPVRQCLIPVPGLLKMLSGARG